MELELDLASERRLYEAGIRPSAEIGLALLSRLEQAEQAVARVRELATAMADHSLPEAPRGGAWETAHGAQLFAKDVLETLDGDG